MYIHRYSSRVNAHSMARSFCSLNTTATAGITGWGAYLNKFTNSPVTNSHLVESFSQTVPARLSLARLLEDRPDLPATLSAVGAGVRHALIAFRDANRSHIVGLGLNRCQQLGISGVDKDPKSIPGLQVTDLSVDGEVLQISCGREHSAMLVRHPENNNKVEVYVCGSNSFGQLGLSKLPEEQPRLQTTPLVALKELTQMLAVNEEPVKVQCGLDHTLVLTSLGRVLAMGWGTDGQIGAGVGSMQVVDCPTFVHGLDGVPIVNISSSTDFTLALSADNDLFFWGNGEYGQCMIGEKNDRVLVPTKVPPLSRGKQRARIAGVAAGGCHSLVLADNGQVYVCGYGALGLGPERTETMVPVRIPELSDIVAIYASDDRCLAIDQQQRVYSWGLGNSAGRLGKNTAGSSNIYVPTLLEMDIKDIDPSLVALGNDIALIGSTI